MKLFLKDKGIQVARIIILLLGGVLLGFGIPLAFMFSLQNPIAFPSPVPFWIANAVIVIIVICAMKWSEPVE